MTVPDGSRYLSHRLVEVPRPASDASARPAATGRLRMLPPLAMAHAAGTTVACCWIRTRPNGPAAVLAGGTRPDPTGDGFCFPAGARTVELRPGQADRALGKLPHWRPVWLLVDALTDRPPSDATDPDGPLLEDLFAYLPEMPMAVLAVGTPIGAGEVAAHLDRLSDIVDALEPRRTGRGTERLRLAEAEAELRYLRRWAAQGHWRIRLFTGARTAAGCDAIAGLLAGGADLADGVLRVRPRGSSGLGGRNGGRDGGRDGGREVIAGADALAAVARAPLRELPGVRVTEPPRFDVTPETAPGGPVPGLLLGTVLDATRGPGLPFEVTADSVNRHTFVTGATGAGKSQTVRTLLEQLAAAGVPWLVVEPAKAEYRAMAARLGGGVIRIRPGDADAVPAGINPLAPVAGFNLSTHLDLVRALFVAAFQASDPFPQVLSAALTRCYEDLGWDLALGEPADPALSPRYPTLADLQRTAELVVGEVGYGREVTDNVRGFIRVRLGALRLGTTGRFFQDGHPVDVAELLKRHVVLEIEDVGDDQDKAFLMGTVVLALTEHLRTSARDARGLRHVTVIEEAHRLLRPGVGAAEHAVEMFAAMLAEVRAYGEGIVIAEQIPAKLIPDVIKNTAIKIVHRLPARDDRDAVGATMNLTDDQSAFLVTLAPGEAAAFADGMDAPVLVRVADGTDRETVAATTASPAAIVTTRSAACGPACHGEPCTLRQMRMAQRFPEALPALTLWAELAVVGHLTGWPLPVPTLDLYTALRAPAERLRDCAIGHAVDAAVAVRSTAISREVSPGALAAHVSTAMRDLLGGRWPCERREPRWLARPRHRRLLFGDARPSALETVVGADADGPAWTTALGTGLATFRKCRWPLAELSEKRWGGTDDGDRRRR
ncbi:ATP-binding protein [Virgisporangium aurantiacum]|uniref:Helicase HerA-like C-terminal domain-containing protein n=1 Tax=Virgisporangium aurantiacum TaxID=175570 RepID=A0A8J3ZIS4_9ACTN|nr:ATP-binding protein [Virgisporangium aurantiacum]GIJ63543.1 hypothetical protein Vau01_110590 [Virgisporangium aurantiacum]